LFAQRLEALLVRAPYDWFNFFQFWDAPLPEDGVAGSSRIAA
ncbi:MAG: hypothetical protein K0R58_1949, partial [Ramlibacter sp.]|nr:hypothetical protein [Ramlibacter sp.]